MALFSTQIMVQESVNNELLNLGSPIQMLETPERSVVFAAWASAFFSAAGAIAVIVGAGFLTAPSTASTLPIGEAVAIVVSLAFALVWVIPAIVNLYTVMMDEKSVATGRSMWWLSAVVLALGVLLVLLAVPMAAFEHDVVGCPAFAAAGEEGPPPCKGLLATFVGTVGCAWGLYLAAYVLSCEFARLARPGDPSDQFDIPNCSSWKQITAEIFFALMGIISLVQLIMIGLVSSDVPYFLAGGLAWTPLILVSPVALLFSQRVVLRDPGTQLNWALISMTFGGFQSFMHLFVAIYVAFFSGDQAFKIGIALINFFFLFCTLAVIILAIDEISRVPH